MSKKRILRLRATKTEWRPLRDGDKGKVYRRANRYWKRLLFGNSFEEIHFLLKGNDARILRFRWIGYSQQTLVVEEFGPDPVEVFVIYCWDRIQ